MENRRRLNPLQNQLKLFRLRSARADLICMSLTSANQMHTLASRNNLQCQRISLRCKKNCPAPKVALALQKRISGGLMMESWGRWAGVGACAARRDRQNGWNATHTGRAALALRSRMATKRRRRTRAARPFLLMHAHNFAN